MNNPRLAPWRRNMIALALGLTIKPSGKMRWQANIDVHGVEAEDTDCFGIFPIEADLEIEAARSAALMVANELYKHGMVTFLSPQNNGTFIVSVGSYVGHGLTQGRSLTVRVERYEGEQ